MRAKGPRCAASFESRASLEGWGGITDFVEDRLSGLELTFSFDGMMNFVAL